MRKLLLLMMTVQCVSLFTSHVNRLNLTEIRNRLQSVTSPRSAIQSVTPRTPLSSHILGKYGQSNEEEVNKRIFYVIPYFFDGAEQYIVLHLQKKKEKMVPISVMAEVGEEDNGRMQESLSKKIISIIGKDFTLTDKWNQGKGDQQHYNSVEISKKNVTMHEKNYELVRISGLEDRWKASISDARLSNFITTSCKKKITFHVLFYEIKHDEIMNFFFPQKDKLSEELLFFENEERINNKIQRIVKDRFDLAKWDEHSFLLYNDQQNAIQIFKLIDMSSAIDLHDFQKVKIEKYNYQNIEKIFNEYDSITFSVYLDELRQICNKIDNNNLSTEALRFIELFKQRYDEAKNERENSYQKNEQHRQLEQERKEKAKQEKKEKERIAKEKREAEQNARSNALPLTARTSENEERNVKVKPHLENIKNTRSKILSRSASLGTISKDSPEKQAVAKKDANKKPISYLPLTEKKEPVVPSHVQEEIEQLQKRSPEEGQIFFQSKDQNEVVEKTGEEKTEEAQDKKEERYPVDTSGVHQEVEELQKRSREEQRALSQKREQKELRKEIEKAKQVKKEERKQQKKEIRETALFIQKIVPYVQSVIEKEKKDEISDSLEAQVFQELKRMDIVFIVAPFNQIERIIPQSFFKDLTIYSRTTVLHFTYLESDENFLFITRIGNEMSELDNSSSKFLAWIVLGQKNSDALFGISDSAIKKVFRRVSISPYLYIASERTEGMQLCNGKVELVPMQKLLKYIHILFPDARENNEDEASVETVFFPKEEGKIPPQNSNEQDAQIKNVVDKQKQEISNIPIDVSVTSKSEDSEKQDLGKINLAIELPWWENALNKLNSWWKSFIHWFD